MEEGKRDWSTGFTRPYYKVFPFVKENISKLGFLALLEVILSIILMIIGYLLYIIAYILEIIVMVAVFVGIIIVVILLFVVGLPEWIIIIVGIIFGILGVFLYFAIYGIFITAIGSVSFGLEIFICRKILDIFKGEPLTFDIIKMEIEKEWKIYLEKGLKLFLSYMVVVLPIILLPILFVILAILVIIIVLIMIDAFVFLFFGQLLLYIGFLFFYMIILIFALLLAPFISYVLDWAALRIADGMGVWESVKEAITYIWKKPKLMKYYWVGYFLINLVSMFVYPVAMIISFVLPILSKIFILINDEEYG